MLNTMAKVSKLYHSPFLRYPTAFLKTHFLLRKWLFFIPRAPEIPTSHFSGVLNTMAKVSKLYHSPFLRYPTAFSQNTFLLRKWLFFIPSAPEIPTSKFSGMLNTIVTVLKVSVPISGVYEATNEKMFIQFCEAQPISAISLKICTPQLQLLRNTEQRSLDMER